MPFNQGLVKKDTNFVSEIFDFYFWHGESTSTASQQTSTVSQLSKGQNKVPLILQNLDLMSDRIK